MSKHKNIFIPTSSKPVLKKKSICLNMIVKNEEKVIEKCLNSVKRLIDYWVIVDTGSSDSTREIIKTCLKDIPGELHERPWENFAHNRNEALALAKNKGDYLLLIDADEILEFDKKFSLPNLDKDHYFIIVRALGQSDAKRSGLIRNHLNWKWEGVFHEVVVCPEAKTSEVLKGVINLCNTHGLRSSGRGQEEEGTAAYLRDAQVLEKALEKEPDNSRYAYYLAVTYLAAHNFGSAISWFKKRIAMPSSDLHETFLAMYYLGISFELSNQPDAALDAFFQAFAFHPTRAEPLYHCALIYRTKGNILLGYLLAKHALSLPYPEEDLYVEYMIYDHTLLIEFANCALLLGKFKEGLDACKKLLANKNLPPVYKPQVMSNYELARKNVLKCEA